MNGMQTKIIAGVIGGLILMGIGWLGKSQYDDGILLSKIVTTQETQAKLLDDHEVRLRFMENSRRQDYLDPGPLDGG